MQLVRLFFGVALLGLALGGAAPAPFDHRPWTLVLERFVDVEGRVDYRGLARERGDFDRYVALVEQVGPGDSPELFPTRNDRLAYCLNAYNALTWKGVLARGPEEESVWKGLIPGHEFFKVMKIRVGGDTTTLSELEDEVIRAGFMDPRVHAALNCASIGCPKLGREAFTADQLDDQLNAAVRAWVNDPYHVAAHGDRIRLNKIFDWFRKDFLAYERKQGNASPTLTHWINRYRSPGQQLPDGLVEVFNEYDQRLNKQ